jgi:hypothetical protein
LVEQFEQSVHFEQSEQFEQPEQFVQSPHAGEAAMSRSPLMPKLGCFAASREGRGSTSISKSLTK